ncbi:hypothetical protein BJ878DRAFT_245490 [Calycina marina]|uniref:CCHC-type domain-containing protein n=1 Tax=Calycina marina TaxID=1763456 RepID=A0A9P7YWS0_9HELO|nr:hypothetical protein BJ878DRAFT_245490 [Calycina marina]
MGSVAIITFLKRTIHFLLLECMSLTDVKDQPTTFIEFVAWLRKQEQGLRSSQFDYFKAKKRDNQHHGHYTACGHLASHTPSAARSHTTTEGGDAMDISAVTWKGSQGGAIRPENDTERAAKRKYCQNNRLCFYCESPDHSTENCNLAPASKNKKNLAEEGKA